jgi:hypothetical protein
MSVKHLERIAMQKRLRYEIRLLELQDAEDRLYGAQEVVKAVSQNTRDALKDLLEANIRYLQSELSEKPIKAKKRSR